MPTEVSKIEEIIKNDLKEETRKSIDELVTRMAGETQQAVDRINGVYGSALKTLKQLELTDATVFDFFQKTNGNIRVAEINNIFISRLHVNTASGMMMFENPIQLKEKTRYKIIMMAMEIAPEVVA